jgi:hypothetical protein
VSKRKRAEAAVLEQEAVMDNPRRDLLEAYLPDGLDGATSNRLLDALSVLSQFTTEELQRVQLAAVLLLLESQQRLLERVDLILEELKLRSSDEEDHDAGSDGFVGGFDPLYFYNLIEHYLGEKPDNETLVRLFELAGHPGRLERAVMATHKSMEKKPLESPLGYLIVKLRRWREENDGHGKRQRGWER